MKKVKLFEEFHTDLSSANEGMMSNIDIIGQEAETRESFKKDVKDFLAKNALDPKVADNDEFIEGLADNYFYKDKKRKS